ncbi:hypothetical protein AWZ03_014963 [Drosophila navojoa]|uniref:Uncharacterized protein n=1 Tax=Drosophila navojoa TaxID=7232 RepID=A0A484AQ64_DRONA|nr:hypothetical protein AWZ03_014963 [Drosophila navojoa]
MDVDLAGKTAEAILLIMPTMLDHVILGMNFLCAIGTRVRCGNAELEMKMVEDSEKGASSSDGRGAEENSSCFRGQDWIARGDIKGSGPEVSSNEKEEREGKRMNKKNRINEGKVMSRGTPT